jgi:hypothetical protein
MVLRRCAVCARSGLLYNQLSGSIPSSLGSLTALQELCVRRCCCCLHGMVLRRCAVCARSYLHVNQLSGTIPSSLGSLTGLQQLCVRRVADRPCTALRRPACAFSYLNDNQLSGTIPSSLGSLTGLQNLCVHCARCGSPSHSAEACAYALSDLHNSQLSGTIPSSLGSLTGLQNLCVRRRLLFARLRRSAEAPRRVWMCARSGLSNSGLCGTVPMAHQPDDGALPACAGI